MKHGICLRVCSIAILAVIVVFVLQTVALAAPIQVPQAQPTGPKIWLGERQQLPMQAGGASAGAALLNGHAALPPAGAQPLSLTTGDVDEDGVADLLVGYSGHLSIQRGNLDAFAPQSDASFQAIAHGQFPAPFLAQSSTLATPVNPDFIAVGRFTASGHNDLVIAAKGGSVLYVFAGDGKGNFAAPQAVNLPGGVTAMLGGNLGRGNSFTQVILGINGQSGPELAVFNGGQDGLDPVAAFPLSGAASNLTFGDFGDGGNDLAFLSNGKVQILRASTMKLQQVSLPISAIGLAVGTFVIDRVPGLQLALLTADGTIHIAAHNEFDPRAYTADELKALHPTEILRGDPNPLLPARVFPANGWKIVEDINAAATFAAGQPPVLFRTRISDHQMDDVMVLNGSTGQLTVVAHPDVAPGAQTFTPAVLSARPYGGTPLAAISTRINVDGRPGVLAIHQGESAPSMLMPLPDPTFTVNRNDDPVPVSPIANACNGVANDCSLREAILKANATAGTDTISLPAGTYTLTLPRIANNFNGQQGTLEITDSVNIVGAGQATTIIQGGALADLSDSVDKVMSINEDIAVVTSASVSLSNLTIQHGRNRGNVSIQDGWGGAFDFDTGTNGTATLTLTNVTLQNNAVFDGQGGGFAAFNVTNPGTGNVTVTNSIIQNNDSTPNANGVAGDGGGLFIDVHSQLIMSNSQVLTNHTHTGGPGPTKATGGGMFLQGQHTQPQSHFSNVVISGNTAAGVGGGINSIATLKIDLQSVISNNTAGANTANAGGGGIANNSSDGLTLDTVSVIGNSTTGDGGGLYTGNGSGGNPVTITFSRFAGNSSTHTPGSSNIFNVTAVTPFDLVTAQNNWWGTNVPSSTIINNGAAAVSVCPATGNNAVCFDPFFVLTHQAIPEKIKINQSATLTADLSKDNHGTLVTGHLQEVVGLPVTFVSGPLGTIPQAQPETLDASAQATATFNAGGTSGRANPTATVDQGTALALDSLISAATEAGTTATITTVGAHGFATGETAVISGVGVGGYNGTFIITATPTVNTFTYTAPGGLAASSGGTANVGIVILEPPQITKSFGAATIAVNGTTTVNFSINNPNVVAINGSFTDTLPVGLQVAATPGVTNTCGGTVTATAGSGSISFSNNLTPVGVCTISVNITGTVDNNYTNSVQILSTDAGNGNTSSANITVINPPTIAKAFGAATIPLNGTTSLTFTLSSTNQNLTLNGVAFTDSLPAGLVVATPSNLNSTCSGTATAVAGSSSVSLSGASLAPGTSCTVSVNVQGTTAGVKNNSVQVTSTNAGTGNTSNASITVVAPPTIAKAFGASSIPLNGSTSLSFTITNPNTTVALTGVGFSDTLPAGLVVSTPNGLTGTCGAGTITATAGTNVISLSGGTIAASASCTFSVNVTGIAAGQQTNTTGNVTSTEGGTGGTATASVNVEAPPSIAKVFNPSTIALNATTSLTFTITNPAANVDSLFGVAFTDTLPTGLTVANASTTVCGGTLTTTAPTGISLVGATIAANGQCQFSVTVTGAASGQYTNTTGNVSSTNGGTGNTASANLTVATPPTITKAFGAASIPLNGTTSLTFTIQNPNTGLTLTGIAFTDNLPAGLVVATPNGLNNTCGGTATAVAGSGSISLSAGTLAASASCTVSVNVQGTTAGVKNNSVQVTSTEGGTGNTSNASITVVGPPVIIKAFGAASIPLNGSTSLSFTIQNNNTTTTLTGVGFSDTLPAGLVVSTPNGLTGTCGGGTITATQATNVISLSGASIAASSSCTFSVNVTGIAAGTQNNTTGNVTSTEGGTGGTASASINVVAPPSIAKVFNPATIPLNGTTSLTFTITNPAANAVAENGVAFTDTLPTGLVVATPNGLTNTCGGTATAVAGSTSISLTGGSIAVNTNCTLVVNVTGTASGQYTNTSGAVSSTNGGTGNTASANLTVATPPSITKVFGAASIPLNGTTSLTFTIQNPNTNLALTGIAFTDNLPAGLVVATPNALNNTCGGTATAVAGSGSITLSAGTLAASASCTVSVNVQGTTAGVKNNSVQVTSTEAGTGNTSNASITVTGPPVIIKAFGAASIPLNGSTSLTFTIQNNNTTTTLTGVGFSDTLPAGLVISTPNGLTGSCGGGTITATAGTNVISLSGGSIPASSSCTFSVNVTGIAAGTQNNTTGNVTSTEGGTGGTASASINVVAPPSIAKVFNPSNIALNATTSLTFTITNPAANAVSLTGVAFTDTLPTGLTVASATSSVCGGTLTTTNPTGIALSGATIAANSQCQFSVTVTGAAAGQFTNTTGNVTSTNGGTGNTASANLTVATPPTITKAFGAASILVGANTSLTFTLNNPNTSLALTGIAFSDTLPAGLQVATPNGLATTCSGTVTAAAGSGSISLSGATLAANASCTISLNVTGIAAGVQNNTTGPISSTESGPGATSNTASITVIGPPSIAKAFGAASIQLNGTTTLTFTITNPNATVALTGVGFGDTLPAGLAVANPNGLTGSCGSGTITTGTVSGFSVVNLSGGTIAAGGSCTFSVNVVGTTGGHKVNTTGTVTSSNAGSGNQATASIDVFAPDLAITKTHSGTFTRGQTGAQYTITVSNVGFGPTVGTVTVVDTLPAVTNPPVPTAISGTGWTCTLATLTCTRADALASGSSYPAITLTVNIPKNIQNTFTNKAVVSGGGDVNPTNNTATDTVTLGPPIVMTPQSGTVTVIHGNTATLVINVDAPDPTLGVISFSCSGLPAASACNFSPGSIDPAVTPGPTALTVSVSTARGTASLSAPARPGAAGRKSLYAMFMFPVFGMVLAGFGQLRKRVKLRSMVIMLGLLLLLAIVGCGVAPPAPPPTPGTPAGTFVVTVTATSAGFTATTSFNLVVQ
ncbi:MAG TPA: hypothetical protein VKV30_08925 [Candidatus Angelobacter sp.]|nr:hypothetical protein [Candidatus Angelobacter sp.]